MSSNIRKTRRRLLGVVGAAVIAAAPLAACSQGDSRNGADGAGSSAHSSDPLEQAAAENRDRQVDERFGDSPRVVADADGTGVESSSLFFETAETVVVTAPGPVEELRAASAAVVAHAPLLRATPGSAEALRAEIDRLGASTAVVFGPVGDLGVEGLRQVKAPAGVEGLEALTSLEFTPRDVADPAAAAGAVAGVDDQDPTELRAAWAEPLPAAHTPAGRPEAAAAGAQAPDHRDADAETEDAAEGAAAGKGEQDAASESPAEQADPAGALPPATARENAPVVVATPQSSAVDVANARAYGAEVRMLDYPDPRVSEDATLATAGLADAPLVALGAGFGSPERLSGAIELAARDTEELPGGGHLVFPGRRMIAYYGHPSGGALGVMGERDPQGSLEHLKNITDQYQALDPAEPVVPAFEIIATVASEFPGEDGDYSNEADPAELEPWIDAVTEAGGYAVLDLQPGRGNFLDQAKRYEDLLKRPNVGLALDAEWHMGPDELPAQRVGSVEAHEVDEVSQWLAGLVRDNQLPQKAFVLHQFQVQMLRDREQINTDHAELSYVLHADGHGVPEQKFDTWNVLRQGLSPVWHLAWKNFVDEDKPMFDPEQTYAIDPRPWLVTYQ